VSLDPITRRQLDAGSGRKPPRWPHERLPDGGIAVERPQEEDLRPAATGPRAAEPCRDDTRIVHDQEVAGSKPSADVSEPRVAHVTVGAIEDEEAGRVARLGWELGDGLHRELVGEVVDPEARAAHTGSVAPGRKDQPGAIGVSQVVDQAKMPPGRTPCAK